MIRLVRALCIGGPQDGEDTTAVWGKASFESEGSKYALVCVGVGVPDATSRHVFVAMCNGMDMNSAETWDKINEWVRRLDVENSQAYEDGKTAYKNGKAKCPYPSFHASKDTPHGTVPNLVMSEKRQRWFDGYYDAKHERLLSREYEERK